ncbi:hypothetical protein CB0940_05204 [Cercospora beticola]|uniref:GST C-terminal domain-containing protein n=2 Tax=Cercospora beticola TaxID=122368 RepID=A0A2G5HKM4_CERBT|nr:hypothetical protein CB0940_05204 [Cercospora beticola]PIA93080.1 hypothetical protein CB0940_05204 [Cercospora beticola]
MHSFSEASSTKGLSPVSTIYSKPSSSTSTNPSTRPPSKRRKQSFHASSLAFSFVCKLLAVSNPPPPMLEKPKSSGASVVSVERQALSPICVYGDITGPQLCKVVVILKELHLPYILKVVDVGAIKEDPNSAPCELIRGGPAMEDPNTGIVLWESGAIVDYLEEMYDKVNKLRYTSFPEVWHTKQWAWHQFGGHESLMGQESFISTHEFYGDMVRGTLATIENHLGATGNLYLIGDRITYADLLYVASREAISTTLMRSFVENFEVEWRREWPRTYDWYQRLLMRDSVKKTFQERFEIMEERGWND